MKILHINHSDSFSGAGKAVSRIHENLLKNNVESTLLVRKKNSPLENIYSIELNKYDQIKMSVKEFLEHKISKMLSIDNRKLFSPSLFENLNIKKHPILNKNDLINLYWINGAYLKPEQLKNLNKPIIWRLSDVWPFTGGCHYPGNCNNFTNSCGNCPQLKFQSTKDISYKLWKRKKIAWKNLNINVIAPSTWIEKLAKSSNLFNSYKISMIHTGIDLKIFNPKNKIYFQKKYKLPENEFIVLFGASDFINDARKGFKNFLYELKILSQNKLSKKITVVFFGNKKKINIKTPLKTRTFGFIDGEERISELLSCADVMVVPSLEDNLPNIGIEAIACGVPVIGYNVCGLPDIVKSGWNGELVDISSKGKIADAILKFMLNKEKHKSMKLNSLSHARKNFCLDKQTQKLIKLYKDILTKF